jgi:hypothetical protein
MPFTPGVELCGVVVEVGDGVSNDQLEGRVVGSAALPQHLPSLLSWRQIGCWRRQPRSTMPRRQRSILATTAFVSTAAAWETLPKDLRQRVENLHVVNVTGQQRRGNEEEEDLLQPIREREQSVTTSVGHAHPRIDRTILYVSQMNTREIAELSHDESEELLEALFNHLYDPAHIFEHEWREGDLAAWDNLAIQHARSSVKKEGPVRTLRKVISPIPSMAGIETPKFSKVG